MRLPVDWNVLVVGAGVIGSLYAAQLARRGHHVTLLARGQRLRTVREHGVVLEHQRRRGREHVRVHVLEVLPAAEPFDLIVVAVQQRQAEAALGDLAASRVGGDVLMMTNNAEGYAEWMNTIGRERLLIGFPGAGGALEGPVVRYHVLSRLLQPTTLGEIDGGVTPRVRRVKALFENAGFPVATTQNIDAWQKYHVAWITPVAYAIYLGRDAHVARATLSDEWTLAVRALREAFDALSRLGHPVTPRRLRLLQELPEWAVAWAFRAWARTRHFDTVAVQHSLRAREELAALAEQINVLGHQAGTPMAHWHQLCGDGHSGRAVA